MKKPALPNATIVKSINPEEFRRLGISEEIIKHLLDAPGKEYGIGDVSIGAKYKIKGIDNTTDYKAIKTEGTSNSLSLFRLVGGCNNLDYFLDEGVEKSEDYDSLSATSLLSLPNDYDEAIDKLIESYYGKTLRVVARTAEGTAKFDTRYYLFAIED